MAKKLSLDQKVAYMRIGLALAGICVNDASVEVIVHTYEGILKKGGDFSLEDAVKIEVAVKGKYTEKEVTAHPQKPLPMKIGIICSVRDASQGYTEALYHYVHRLEDAGHTVHFPPRDTDQKGTSLQICASNVEAFRTCDEIHVFYSSRSQGTHFDLGACFAMGKRVKPIISEPLTEGKSFQNLLHEWQKSA